MIQDPGGRFADEARGVRGRLLLDLDDRGARMIDATIRSLRAGTTRFAFRDSLIGLGEGLREALMSWGVPDRCIFTNDTPLAGYFVERKFWDFVVRDASGRDVVAIEFGRIGNGPSDGGQTGFAKFCHGWLGMLYDSSFTQRRPFTGVVAVRYSTRPRGVRDDATARRRLRRFERFDRVCRMSGLLDAMAYLDLSPGAPPRPSPDLGLENLLATLFRKLDTLPVGAFDLPRAVG